MTTGAFKTSATLSLEYLLNVTPLEITTQGSYGCMVPTDAASNSGHSNSSKTLSDITYLCNQTPDYVHQKLGFTCIYESITILFPTN